MDSFLVLEHAWQFCFLNGFYACHSFRLTSLYSYIISMTPSLTSFRSLLKFFPYLKCLPLPHCKSQNLLSQELLAFLMCFIFLHTSYYHLTYYKFVYLFFSLLECNFMMVGTFLSPPPFFKLYPST